MHLPLTVQPNTRDNKGYVFTYPVFFSIELMLLVNIDQHISAM